MDENHIVGQGHKTGRCRTDLGKSVSLGGGGRKRAMHLSEDVLSFRA